MARAPVSQSSTSVTGHLGQSKIELLAILGSVCSIIALVITILDKVAADARLPPQLAGWRFVLMIVALTCMGVTAIATYQWARAAWANTQSSDHVRTVKMTVGIIVGVFVFGIFMDGFFAAIYWKPWLSDLGRLFALAWRQFGN